MTKWSPEQISKLQITGIEAWAGLASKSLECIARLVDLNLQTMKTTLEDGQECARKALSTKDTQELVELQAEFFQPTAEAMLAYRRRVQDIVADAQANVEKVLEVQYAAGKREVQGFMETALSNAPTSSMTPFVAWQEALNATTALFDSMQATAKQAMQMAGSNFDAAAEATSKGARRRPAPAPHTAE
ncbi:phasin family protein [Cupriavidus taiwanensis]|uniref:PHA-granule associated protein 4 n=1 Tax=Cupriavidus taiwanensis TaxID=164546 RepID=A0A375JD01_9BURK|nr:phasin family protein [Cupriavidus taiwanensis]SPS01853.1 PHA-granule associated protein 4 [Cupriavidus taiwanensis]